MPECSNSLFIKDKKSNKYSIAPKYIRVPCGKCPNCLTARSSAWGFRLMQQEKISNTAYFITLTYATEHLPITKNGYGTISKNHLQLFFKRLRKYACERNQSTKSTIKYYAVGEYGGKLKRPHYHIILFNATVRDIAASWTIGHVHYGTVSGASVGYTLKYISKPYKNFKLNDDREKPFSLMSKGLGANYLSPSNIKWHHADMENRMYVNVGEGKKATMPRYYKDRLYGTEEKEAIQRKMKHKFAEEILNQLLQLDADTYERNIVNKKEGQRAQQRKHNLEIQLNQ